MQEFTDREGALFADLARRIEPRVESVADNFVALIGQGLPAGQAASIRAALPALATDFLTGFLTKLAAGDPEAALEFAASFSDRVLKDQLRQPQCEPPLLGHIFAAVHAFGGVQAGAAQVSAGVTPG